MMSTEEIIKKTNLLAKLISEQEEIILYQKAEQQIAKNKKVQILISDIKRKQQELVNAKHLKVINYVKQLEDELDQLNNELHSIPLVGQFQQTQVEINEYIKSVLDIIKLETSKKIPIDSN